MPIPQTRTRWAVAATLWFSDSVTTKEEKPFYVCKLLQLRLNAP